MAKSADPILIKPKKVLPFAFMATFFVITIPIMWPIHWYMLSLLSIMGLLFAGFFVSTYSGYLKLDKGLLYRKSLFGTESVKVSNIREVSGGNSGTFPTSGLGAGIIGLGNAKDGIVSINLFAFKKKELTSLIEQVYRELKPVNPQRAVDLKKAVIRHLPELTNLDKMD